MKDKFTIEVTNWDEIILTEIADKAVKQKDVAQTYALLMRSEYGPDANWEKINNAILGRWKVSGLLRIKKMAMDGSCFAGEGNASA